MKKILLYTVFLYIHLFSAVSVETFDLQKTADNIANMKIRIRNDEGRTLKNVHLRYYFHVDSKKQFKVEPYYTSNATLTMMNVNDSIAYFDLKIELVSQGYYPNGNGFNIALHYENWSKWDKLRDISYISSDVFLKNDNISLYENEKLIYGKEPISDFVEKKNIKIVGFKSLGNAWVEIENVGNSVDSIDGYTLMSSDSVSLNLPKKILNSGGKLCIGKNENSCFNQNEKIIYPNLWNSDYGEIFLKRSDEIVSYVAYGRPGKHASEAFVAGVWDDSLAYFENEIAQTFYNIHFVKNTFYRMKKKRNGNKKTDWYSFSDRDDAFSGRTIPKLIKLIPNKPVLERLPGDDNVIFSWIPIENVPKYYLVIYDAFGNVYKRIETQSNMLHVKLKNGMYRWSVFLGDDDSAGNGIQYNGDGGTTYDVYEMFLQDAAVDTSVHAEVPIDVIKARKDTRMLDVAWLDKIEEHTWDESHLSDSIPDEHAINRCWVVSAQVMNHLYGGNITQDEIVFGVKYDYSEPLISALSPDGGVINEKTSRNDMKKAIEFALTPNDSNHQVVAERHLGSPPYDFVKREIDSNRVVYIDVPSHSMVIYGYVGRENGYVYKYAFLGDNNGNVTNSLFYDSRYSDAEKDTAFAYYTISGLVRNDVRMSNPMINYDSDGDGIVNFDEIFRFKTNSYDYDSDGDGISDKREIYNYTIETIPHSFETTFATYSRLRSYADPDADGLRAELDNDSDKNGINDGLYEKNRIYVVDGGTKTFQSKEIDGVPLQYTLFARDHLFINDGVQCFEDLSLNSYCRIGCDGKHAFSYKAPMIGVSLGVAAHVGDVDVKLADDEVQTISDSSLVMRNRSVIHGNVNIYRRIKSMDGNIYRQAGATILGTTSVLKSFLWPNFYSFMLPSFDDKKTINEKIVKNGESYRLKDGDMFNRLIIENGGTLIVDNGDVYVDSLFQVEPNAHIIFSKPGYKSIVHLNGRILWKVRNNDSLPATYWSSIAKGFKLVQHSSKKMYIEGDWAGTIYAPLAEIILGQSTKNIYGTFLGKDIIVHQYAKVYRVDFSPIEDSGALVLK